MPTGMTRIKGPKPNEIGRIVSRPLSREGMDNYEAVFRKQKQDQQKPNDGKK